MEHEQGLPHLRAACEKVRARVSCSHSAATLEAAQAQARLCPACKQYVDYKLPDDHPYKAQPRPEYAPNKPQMFDKPHVDDWFDDLRDNAALMAWVVVAAALGVFLFVAMAVL